MTDEKNSLSFEKELDRFLPGISVDCVILGYNEGILHTLVLKWKNLDVWSLPGGFVFKNESIDNAAYRVLNQRTGLENVFLKQFETFGGMNRVWNASSKNQHMMQVLMDQMHFDNQHKVKNWFQQRFISVGYFALLNMEDAKPIADFLSEECTWKRVDELPELLLDHSEMIHKVLQHLRNQINYLPIGKELLPKKFTMMDLQSIHEAILQKSLDRGNFQRKILSLKFLKRHEKLMLGAQNKAPYLYSFNEKVYMKSLQKGLGA
nr:NUDIX domain-containing protein [Allomuricauda sp.]